MAKKQELFLLKQVFDIYAGNVATLKAEQLLKQEEQLQAAQGAVNEERAMQEAQMMQVARANEEVAEALRKNAELAEEKAQKEQELEDERKGAAKDQKRIEDLRAAIEKLKKEKPT